MRDLFAALLAIHGAIHLLGFVKAFGLAKVAPIQQSISRPVGLLWLAAALGFLASALLLLVDRRPGSPWCQWWILAAPSLVLSQAVIVASWRDARFGTIANIIVLVPVTLALLDLRGASLRSTYEREVKQAATGATAGALITEADLQPLPAPVRAYLRRVGVVGKPRVRTFHAVFRAEIRDAPTAAWMTATVDQHSYYGPPARLFFMQASRAGIPFDAFHRYVGDAATMQVRIAGLIPIVDVSGPEITQSETVTMLNDMCFLAPGALVDAAITWQTIDDHQVQATFTNAGKTISAVLSFDAGGDLVGFVSHQRYQSDGKTHRLFPWSTPLRDYRDFGGYRLAAEGEARWQEPTGEWTYGRFTLQRIEYNRGAR